MFILELAENTRRMIVISLWSIITEKTIITKPFDSKLSNNEKEKVLHEEEHY